MGLAKLRPCSSASQWIPSLGLFCCAISEAAKKRRSRWLFLSCRHFLTSPTNLSKLARA